MGEARVCLAIRWGMPSSSTATLGCVILWVANASNQIQLRWQKSHRQECLCYSNKELRHAAEFAEALEAALGGERAVLLHHLAHLQVLLQDLVHFLHGGAAAAGDAFPALGVAVG